MFRRLVHSARNLYLCPRPLKRSVGNSCDRNTAVASNENTGVVDARCAQLRTIGLIRLEFEFVRAESAWNWHLASLRFRAPALSGKEFCSNLILTDRTTLTGTSI